MDEPKSQPNRPSGMVDLPKVGQIQEGSKVGAADVNRDISDSLSKSMERARTRRQNRLRMERQKKESSTFEDVFSKSGYGKIETKKFRKALAPHHAKYSTLNPVERFQTKDPVKWKKLFKEKYPELDKPYIEKKDIRITKKKLGDELKKGSLSYAQKDEIRRKIKTLEDFSSVSSLQKTKKASLNPHKKTFLARIRDLGKAS